MSHATMVEASVARLVPALRAPHAFHGLYGDAAVMRVLYRALGRAGRAEMPVLLTGEGGSGKSLAARALHEESARRDGPFVAVHCASHATAHVERELFGSVRGAYPGAVRDHAGLVEAAHGGTLFLDQVDALSASAQARLLRLLATGETTRLGAESPTQVDVRIVASSARPLEALVQEDRFRDDLLYRLNVVTLAMPPLREHKTDIPLLATRFMQLFAERHGLPPRRLSTAALARLMRHEWPGNVRELRNVIEGALVMCDSDEIDAGDLPATLALGHPSVSSGATSSAMLPAPAPTRAATTPSVMSPVMPPVVSLVEAAAGLPFAEARAVALREFDRAYLGAALARHDGNIARTARALGLHRQSLQKLLVRRALRGGDYVGGDYAGGEPVDGAPAQA
ncbi:MAG: sigma-54 dependent transcriptional regulator [Gemmatimonadetes bacterium]|nr:sigma-54 dependent transcriptional regulator [Gemmatimonadota bacterium]